MISQPQWTNLHARLHQTLRQRQLLAKQERILVAVSGGQDSLCMMKLLLDLQPKWLWELGMAHCDHRWLSDQGMAEHVEQIALAWNLPFYLKIAPSPRKQDTKANPETEAAARKWRYQALVEIAQEGKFPVIVTGHTKSDRAETLLYNLIRGSGADGLQALSWERSLNNNIQLVRPLLNIDRQETGAFCQQFQLPIWEDVVNQNLHYARNRMRAEVIPYLQKHFNPQVETHLAQTSEVLKAEVDFLENLADQLLRQCFNEQQDSINRIKLRDHHLALQRRVMRQFLHQILPQAPNFATIEALTKLINAPNRSRTSSLPGGKFAEVTGDYIVIKNND